LPIGPSKRRAVPTIGPRAPAISDTHDTTITSAIDQGPNGDDESERQIQRRIGDDIGELVQIRTERRLLAEFARQHAVDRVERHPREEDERQQQERPDRVRRERDESSGGDDIASASTVTWLAVTPRRRGGRRAAATTPGTSA
jgi:hypothetical protein